MNILKEWKEIGFTEILFSIPSWDEQIHKWAYEEKQI